MLAHDWFMEIDLIPNAYVRKFSNELKKKISP